MRAPAATSPFAAKSSQEQKEQWIWWQCQQDATLPAETRPIANERLASVPELTFPRKQEEAPEPAPVKRPAIRHGQYDAVVRRMQNATRQVRGYTSLKG